MNLIARRQQMARRWSLAAALVVLVPSAMSAQATMGEMRRQATRSELELAVKATDAASLRARDEKTREKLRADAAAMRARLANGDFAPGDRILLLVEGDSVLSDTFTVRGDRMLPLANVAEISLQGVLDSELEPFLTKELLRYIKRVSLTATPLVRISLLGFPNANFYTVPVDQAITDVIAAAGGWGPQAAHDKAVVRRAGKLLLDARSTADAVRLGKTVGDMSLRDGDELFVPDKASAGFNLQQGLAIVSTLTTVYFIFRYGLNRGTP